MLTQFADLIVGAKFRCVGGVTVFLKTFDGWACVDGQPNKACHVPPDQVVFATGEFTSLSS